MLCICDTFKLTNAPYVFNKYYSGDSKYNCSLLIHILIKAGMTMQLRVYWTRWRHLETYFAWLEVQRQYICIYIYVCVVKITLN